MLYSVKGAGFHSYLVILLLLMGLLLAACGDNTSVPEVAPTTAAGNSPANASAKSKTTGPAANGMTGTTDVSGEVIVFAASSLTEPFNEMKAKLEKAHPDLKIMINFGASNTLRTQLEQGAKADLFASANQTEMDLALKAGLVAGQGKTFVRNRLVLILPLGNPGQVARLQDLAKPGLKFVTAQKDVPVGGYTLTALDKMSLDPAYGSDFSVKVQANIVSREANVKQVVSKVQLGEADAGIVYFSDVSATISSEITTLDIPDQFNTLASYPISILKASANPTGAKVFQNYVLGTEGQAILKKNNFIPAGVATSGQGETRQA